VAEEPVVYLITGPMDAGTSTVARLLASRFERGVHLEGDVFRFGYGEAKSDFVEGVLRSARN
jgi:cytidylate kinase